MSDNQDPDHTVVLGGAATPETQATRVEETPHNALPVGTRLGEFEIIGLVGEGGFGIVYLAKDHSLQRMIALKEYMPASLAARSSNASVVVRSERHQETFDIGRRSFVNEARLLAQFDHPALVKVYRFWESNGTAYMVMPYYEGKTLREVLHERNTPPDEAWIQKTLAPVIDALELIHKENCFHRDIAPDNIMLLPNGRPVLLDFGAARRVIGDMTQALTVILKPGYAPIEQYAEMPGMKQGAWTDVYALAAVIYFMLARKLPPPSVSRMVQDSYEPLATLVTGPYSEALLKGVDQCLSVRPEQRPQTMAEMRQLLGFPAQVSVQAPAQAAPKPAVGKPRPVPSAIAPSQAKSGKGVLVVVIIAGVLLVLGGAGAAGYYFLNRLAGNALDQVEAAVSQPVGQSDTQVPAQEASTPKTTPPAGPHSLAEAINTLSNQADPALAPSLKLPPTISVNGGVLTLSATAPAAGHLYLFLWDKSTDKFYRLFPNDLDSATAITAGGMLTVPRANLPIPWGFAASEPAGNWQVFALLSEQPRDLGKTRLSADAGFVSAQRAGLDSVFSGGAGLDALIGTPVCTDDGACKDRYGFASASLQEVAEVVKSTAEPRQEQPKPAREKPAGKPSGKNETGNQSEREYMKKLNKDLDKLLGQ